MSLTDSAQSMPPWMEFVLTRKIPCAMLAGIMLTALFWLPGIFAELPLLAFISSFFSSALHMLTPALFATITLGGGIIFALQTALITALIVFVLAGFSIWPALMFLAFYAIVPAVVASLLQKEHGFNRGVQLLLAAMFTATLVFLLGGAITQGADDLQSFIRSLIEPVLAAVPDSQRQLRGSNAIEQATTFLVWMLPGSLALSFWSTWLLNVLLARRIATRHGFYNGDQTPILQLRFSHPVAYAFVVMLLLANFTDGSLQYIAVCAAILIGGALSVQGVFIAHIWLKARDMQIMIAVMYVTLLMWSMIVIPFMILGLLDIWYDYRRNIEPAMEDK